MPENGVQTQATDWQAVALASAVPLVIAAGFVKAASAVQWGPPPEDWVWGLLALVPLEFVRAIVLSNLGDAYRNYHDPQHAVRKFLASIGSLAVVGVGWGILNFGPGAIFALLTNSRAEHLLGVPIVVFVAECAIALYFFRGDVRGEAARVQAAASDADDWIFLATFYLPPLLLVLFVGYLFAEHRAALSAWFDNPDASILVPPVLYYGAAYFCVKAVLMAHVHTAQFDRDGRRLLGAGWVQSLLMRSDEERQKESEALRFRQAVLAGNPPPQAPARRRAVRSRSTTGP